jgi:hypothetical protein
MGVKLKLSILLVFGALLISSCSFETLDKKAKPRLYVAEEAGPKTFVVGDKGDFGWIDNTRVHRQALNELRALRDYEDDIEEFEIESRLSNVGRSFVNDLDQSVFIVGFDEELDDPGFEKVDSRKYGFKKSPEHHVFMYGYREFYQVN